MRDNAPKKKRQTCVLPDRSTGLEIRNKSHTNCKLFGPNMTGTVAEGTIQLVRLRLGILSNGRLSTSLAAPQ